MQIIHLIAIGQRPPAPDRWVAGPDVPTAGENEGATHKLRYLKRTGTGGEAPSGMVRCRSSDQARRSVVWPAGRVGSVHR